MKLSGQIEQAIKAIDGTEEESTQVCEYCLSEIEKDLKVCPNCGAPMKRKQIANSENINKKTVKVKNSIVILFLIFFFPVGLFLMWKYTEWNKKTKIIITVIVSIMSVYIIGTNGTTSNTSATNSKSDSKSSNSITTTKKTESKPKIELIMLQN